MRGGTLCDRPAAGTRLLLLCIAGFLCLGSMPSRADTPFVVDPWRFGTQETNAALRYCIDERDPDWPVARRIAAAVAAALLLQPKEYLIGDDPRSTDMSGEDLDDTYRMLIQHCDVFFGFKLVQDAYPGWVTITRPYYRGAYVYVAAERGWKSLGDMPTTRAIGATIGTSADMRLTQYLLAASAPRNAGTNTRCRPTRRRCGPCCTGPRARLWYGPRRSGRCGRPMPTSRNCRRWRLARCRYRPPMSAPYC